MNFRSTLSTPLNVLPGVVAEMAISTSPNMELGHRPLWNDGRILI